MHIDTARKELTMATLLTRELIRTPYVGPQLLQNDIRGQLEQYIRYKEDGQGDVELVSGELELFAQAVHGRVGDIDSVHYISVEKKLQAIVGYLSKNAIRYNRQSIGSNLKSIFLRSFLSLSSKDRSPSST